MSKVLDRLLAASLNQQRWLAFLLGLFTGLFITLVVWPSQTAVVRFDDPYGFATMGRSIAEGRGMTQLEHPELPTLRRAPLYPGFIALLYLIGGPHTILVQIAQCFLVGGTCLLAFEIGRLVFSPGTGLVATVLCAFHPMVLRYVPDIQVECFLTFMTTLMVWRGVRFVQNPSIVNGALVGAAGALAALIKGVVVVVPPIFAAFWLIQRLRAKERFQLRAFVPLIAMALAMCVVIFPWTARNYNVTGGKFVLISVNAGGEFMRGFVFAQPKYFLLQKLPYTDGELEANQMQADGFAELGLVWGRDEAETEMISSRLAKEKLRAEPFAVIPKFAVAFFMFWYVLAGKANSVLVAVLAVMAWALAFVGFRRARSEGIATWPLFLPIVTTNVMYALILALGRYSAPLIPTLIVLASFGIVTLWERRRVNARA